MEYRILDQGKRIKSLCCPGAMFDREGCANCGRATYSHAGELPKAFAAAGLIPLKDAERIEQEAIRAAENSAEALAELRSNYRSLQSKAERWHAQSQSLATQVNDLTSEREDLRARVKGLDAEIAILRKALGERGDTVPSLIEDADPKALVKAANDLLKAAGETTLRGKTAAERAAEYLRGLDVDTVRSALAEAA